MWQNIIFIVIGLGVLTLVGWGAWSFFSDANVDLWGKLVVGVVGGGFAVLLGIAIKDRLKSAKTDKFKGVDK